MCTHEGDKMKIYLSEPPAVSGNADARIDALTRWLSEVAVQLNVGLQNIGKENLCEELRKKLEE